MSGIIAIRADGNSEVGFGHLMRTQALARQLEKCGARVIFLSRNPENVRDYQVEMLNHTADFDAEDTAVEEILQRYGVDMLIIDSYAYDQSRLERMAGLDLITVCIDDMNLHEFNVDFVVNGNLYAPQLKYNGRACQLLGSEFLLLREDFNRLSARQIGLPMRDVLISLGAADMENATPGLLKILFDYSHFTELEWHVVIGPVFKNADQIDFLARKYSNVHIYHKPPIKNLMSFCDIAISAAGSTIYELAACGVPAISVVVADNQLMLAEEAERQGLAINLGWYQKLQPDKLFRSLEELRDDCETRARMSARGQSLIDGRGAERLAEILLHAVRRKVDAGDDKG